MSRATKRKLVTAEVRDSFDVLPDAGRGQRIVRVAAPRGNNLHEVEAPAAEEQGRLEAFLVSMPNKFRKNVWIKRGDFVLVTPIQEGGKVKAEITAVLFKEQIKYIKSEGAWPKEFEDDKEDSIKDGEVEGRLERLSVAEKEQEASESGSESDDDDSDLFRNTNRPVVEISDEDDDTDSSEEEGDDDGEEGEGEKVQEGS